jgi:hypothetical protein
MGLLGMVYVAGRSCGKFLGARISSRVLNLDPKVQRYLGFSLMAHAGLAVGLLLSVGQRYPEYYTVLHPVVLSSIALFEMLGPISVRFAIVEAGESKTRSPDTGSIWALE